MEKPSSYSVAPSDPERQGILSRGALVGVVAVALVGLALVFPKTDLLSRLRTGVGGEGADQELTIAYLRNLIRTERADVGLRLLFIEKLIAAREFDEAERVLQDTRPLLLSQADGLAKWNTLDTQLAWARFRSIRERLLAGQNSSKTPLSAAAAEQASAELSRMREQLQAKLRTAIASVSTPAQAFALMTQARDLEAPALVRELLTRLRSMPQASAADLRRAGQELLAVGEMQEAALAYFAAKNKSSDSAAQREALMLGVKALLAAGQPVQAYEAALREIGPLSQLPIGDDFHWQLVDLALIAGKPREAAQHMRQVVLPEWDSVTLAKKLDAKQLAKALDVALAGADLPEAYKLAQAGLILNPQDTKLRERFAQVAEWAGKPQEALAAWLLLMQRGASERALDNVFRLAPMLYDDEALLAAWAAAQGRRALTLPEVQRIVQVYERIGEPGKALSFLERLAQAPQGLVADSALEKQSNSAFEQKPTVRLTAVQWLRVMISELHERMGQTREAIAQLEALREQQGDAGLNRREAMRLARLQVRQGRFTEALRALLAHRSAGQPFDTEYWQMRADVAYEAQRPDIYPDALRRLLAADSQELLLAEYQIERLLRHTLDEGEPRELMLLAKQLYPRVQSPEAQDLIATLWLEAMAQAPKREDYNSWKTTLSRAHHERISRHADLLSRRAGVLASLGDKKEAAADYRASLALRSDTPTRVSYWWLLIDMADLNSLRIALAEGGPALRNDPAFLEVQGAAWQLLGQWRRALGFYMQQSRQQAKVQDHLWLANYADVLDAAGESALALRVRRHAFMLLSQQINQLDARKKREAAQALIVRLRLSESFASGEEKSRLAAALGQLLRGEDIPADLRKQADDLVVSWALGVQYSPRTALARQWLWQQQARKLEGAQNDAQYAELALALTEGDVQTLDRLMESSARKLQQQDQLAALRVLARASPQRLAEAATLATELAQREPESPKSDELQEALQADVLQLASRAQLQFVSRQQDALSLRGWRVSGSTPLSPRLRLSTELNLLQPRTNDTTVLASTPAQDRELVIGIKHSIDGGDVQASASFRQALAQAAGLALKITRQITDRLSLQALLQIRQRSEDSAPLAVAGVQDKVAAQLSYNLSKDWVVGGELAHTRYRTQGGAYLGRSTSVGANATYYLRREYPDWSARLAWRRNSTRADGQSDAATAVLNPAGSVPAASFFVPQGASSLALSLGWGLTQSLDAGDVYAGPYSHKLRPWGEIGLEHRLANGAQSAQTTPLVRLGLRGSVLGRDQWSAAMQVRPTPGGKTARELRLQYEWIGDR